jgi:hypothetical protein
MRCRPSRRCRQAKAHALGGDVPRRAAKDLRFTLENRDRPGNFGTDAPGDRSKHRGKHNRTENGHATSLPWMRRLQPAPSPAC